MTAAPLFAAAVHVTASVASPATSVTDPGAPGRSPTTQVNAAVVAVIPALSVTVTVIPPELSGVLGAVPLITPVDASRVSQLGSPAAYV